MRGLFLILLFQLAGTGIVEWSGAPLPGAILGLVLFFVYLLLTHGGTASERKTGEYLIRHLPLFFVPAGVGIMTYGNLLRDQALPIGLAIFLGTLLSFLFTALLMQHLLQKPNGKREDSDGAG